MVAEVFMDCNDANEENIPLPLVVFSYTNLQFVSFPIYPNCGSMDCLLWNCRGVRGVVFLPLSETLFEYTSLILWQIWNLE